MGFFMSKITALFTLIFSLGLVSSAQASDLKDLFDSFSSGSAGLYRASNGTHLYGGNITARIHQPQSRDVVGFTPPSLKAGCGGIDFYAGGFSMISGDEIVQMARGIAQGAAPYFFKLAITSICSNCGAAMEHLENRLANINEFARTSCESFYDRFDESVGKSWGKSMNNMVGFELPAFENQKGYGNWTDKVFKAPTDPKDAPSEIIELLETNAPYTHIDKTLGAVNFAQSPFYKGSGSEIKARSAYLELIMTMTGASTFVPGRSPHEQVTVTSDLTAAALIFGNAKDANQKAITKYTELFCPRGANDVALNNCANVGTRDASKPALYARYMELLDGPDGIFRKLQAKRSFSGSSLDQAQLSFMAIADYPYVGIAVRAKHSTDLHAASKYIALRASYDMTIQLYTNAIQLLLRSKDTNINERQADVNKAKIQEYIDALMAQIVEAERQYKLEMDDINEKSIQNLSFLNAIQKLSN